jgi:mRNA interferase MazF
VVFGRGELWWAELPEPKSFGPGYRRPVIVVQSDAFNRSRIQTVIVVALTTNLRLIDAPGNVLVPARVSGLSRDSVANVSQILTIDRDILLERIGRLSTRVLEQVEQGLRTVLEL